MHRAFMNAKSRSVMDCQVVSNIILSILSFILAAIAVVVSVLTLRQNNKMIESNTRPYVGITGDFINLGTKHYKLIMKNYGNSEAYITQIEFKPSLLGFSTREDIDPFTRFIDSTILPGQAVICPLSMEKVLECEYDFIEADIAYKAGKSKNAKDYSESFNIPLKAFVSAPLNDSGSSKSKEENTLHNISCTLQTMTDKML